MRTHARTKSTATHARLARLTELVRVLTCLLVEVTLTTHSRLTRLLCLRINVTIRSLDALAVISVRVIVTALIFTATNGSES